MSALPIFLVLGTQDHTKGSSCTEPYIFGFLLGSTNFPKSYDKCGKIYIYVCVLYIFVECNKKVNELNSVD